MRKEIIINSTINEVRVAITEDGHLAEYLIELPEKEKLLGNVYYGKISKVATGISAAFVDVGMHQDGFLHFSDVDDTNLYNNFDDASADDDEDIELDENDKKRISAVGSVTREFATFNTKGGEVIINLQENKEVLVQVVREAYSHKGMKVTTKIAIPGRYVVMLPFDKMIGISRRIRNDNERRRLRRLARKSLPPGFGCIIRTASFGKTEEELLQDWDNLLTTWKDSEQKILAARKTQTPSLVYQDMTLATSIIRDFFKNDISRVIVDSAKLYNTITSYLKINEARFVDKVEYYNGITPIFETLGIENELARTYKRTLTLGNGGDIVIDRTEALTVIDVNSGKSSETDQEKNALLTNIEAAREIAKQLRLRDIGGIIIVDFIDMEKDEYKKKLFNEMLSVIRYDRAKMIIYPLTQLGLMQITRQRVNQNLSEKMSDVCPTCNGRGRIASSATLLNSIEMWLRNFSKRTNEFKINLIVHPQVAEFITDGETSIVSRLMLKYFVKINVQQSDTCAMDAFRIVSVRKQKDITNDYK
ncbi:MAG: Rne/Rng family ribonuclease [Ignavibacteria bacterium]|jgi:ribonuclease G|nr:Rne/Rng family ribonuclease [Ignavibacteria bacterium]